MSAVEEAIGVLKLHGITPTPAHGITPFDVLIRESRYPNPLYMYVRGNRSKIDPRSESSLAVDLMNGRTTEIDYLNGEIVRLAEMKRIKAPVNEGLTRLVHQAEQEKRRPQIPGKELAQLIHAPILYDPFWIGAATIGAVMAAGLAANRSRM